MADKLALVAHPTYVGKEGCLREWLDGYNALTYEPRDNFIVDNTAFGTQYLATLQSHGLNAIHLQPWTDEHPRKTFHRCWQLILERALEVGAYWVYSVEADNVPAPESLEMMTDISLYGKVHLVTHDYPMHADAAAASGLDMAAFHYRELGCMLLTTQLLERALQIYDEYMDVAKSIFMACQRAHAGWCALTEAFEVQHLSTYQMEFNQFTDPESPDDVRCPTPILPADAGTVIPPSLAALLEKVPG